MKTNTSHTPKSLWVNFLFVGTAVLLMTPVQTVNAAWKNLCPDQVSCPALSPYPALSHIVKTKFMGINEPPGKIIGGVALPYQAGPKTEINSLLSYSDRTDLPMLEDTGYTRQIMQHSSGNWLAGYSPITVFNSTGNQIGSTGWIDPEDEFAASYYNFISGSIQEKNGSLFRITNIGSPQAPVAFHVSRDSGISWDERITSFESAGRGLFDNAFGKGFFVIGRNKPLASEPSSPLGLYWIPEALETIERWEPASRVDDLKPIISYGAHLQSIALDLSTVTANEKIIYGATDKGLFISRDAGRSWFSVTTMTEPLSSVAVIHDHHPKMLLVTTADQVLVSQDQGVSWTPFGLGLYLGKHRVYYKQGQLLIRGQAGWDRCMDFECDGKPSLLPPSGQTGNKMRVVEFYHAELDHYFITSNPEEITGIDNGSAGTGWARTGYEFSVWTPLGHPNKVGKAVCRFYGSTTPGPNSHFFSMRADECERLHTLQKQTPDDQPRWNFESLAFEVEAVSPSGFCRSGRIPIFRAYNNGYALDKDSNHRFVSDRAEIDKLVAKGWIDEGIGFCVPNEAEPTGSP